MFDYRDHRCFCSDNARAAAMDMLQVCKTRNLTVSEASDAIEHLNAHIAFLSLHSQVSVLSVQKEADDK